MAQIKYYFLLLLVCVIWGATPACGKLTVEAFSPLMITGTRFLCIAALLFSWMLITRDFKGFRPSRDVIYVMLGMGFMGILVHNGLLFLGLNYTTATNTALIESIGPTVTTLLAFFFLGERLNRFGWLGIGISCLGALFIVCKGSLDILLSLSFNIGDLLILACEVAWSSYIIVSWRANGKIAIIPLTAWSGLFGALMCFAVGGASQSLHIYNVTPTALWAFAFIVIFSGVVGFVGWNLGVQKVGASKAGVFIYLVPLTGGIVGVVLLGEELLMSQLIGAALILSGVFLTVRSKVQIKDHKQAKLEQKLIAAGKNPESVIAKFPELVQEAQENEQARRAALQETTSKSEQCKAEEATISSHTRTSASSAV